jgi:NitT/TauT family transport system substrate-binding protein
MKIKKLLTTGSITAAIFCALSFSTITPASAAEEVKISGFTWPGYGFWFIAKDKNLAPTLDINYQTIEDPYESYNLITADQMDVVSSTAEFAPIAAERGMPLKLVAFGNLSYGTDKILGAPGIKGPADLKGKKLPWSKAAWRRFTWRCGSSAMATHSTLSNMPSSSPTTPLRQ